MSDISASDISPSDIFPPTLAAAQQRIAAIRPAAYASSRNHLGGAVTRLSAAQRSAIGQRADAIRSGALES